MLRHTLGALAVGGLLVCSAPASAGLFGGNGGGGPFGGGGLFGKKGNDCQPACQPVQTCNTGCATAGYAAPAQQYVTIAVPNSQLYGSQVQQTSYAAPASDCGCSGSTTSYAQPSYAPSQPTYTESYSAPVDSGCSTCGSAPAISYAQPTQSYGQSYSVASTSTCGGATTQSFGQSYAQQSYSSGIVQTSGSDCGCSGSTGVVTSSYGQPTQSYSQPMTGSVQYGQPTQSYGQPMGSTSGCATCSQGVVDGTQNFGQPTADPQFQNQGQMNGTVNYGSTLQDGGYINEQPLNSTQQGQPSGSQDGTLQNNSQGSGNATQAPEVPGSIGGDEA